MCRPKERPVYGQNPLYDDYLIFCKLNYLIIQTGSTCQNYIDIFECVAACPFKELLQL